MYKYFCVNATAKNVDELIAALLSKTGGELWCREDYKSYTHYTYSSRIDTEDLVFIKIKTEDPRQTMKEFNSYRKSLEELFNMSFISWLIMKEDNENE